jgi:hypothetical protein
MSKKPRMIVGSLYGYEIGEIVESVVLMALSVVGLEAFLL